MDERPTIRIKLEGKGGSGASLENLAHVAANAAKFLKMLSVDLGEPSEDWVAEDFINASIGFKIENRRYHTGKLWERGLHEIASGSVNDEEINLRLRRETRLQYFRIAPKGGKRPSSRIWQIPVKRICGMAFFPWT